MSSLGRTVAESLDRELFRLKLITVAGSALSGLRELPRTVQLLPSLLTELLTTEIWIVQDGDTSRAGQHLFE
jgi:hypothetical protein